MSNWQPELQEKSQAGPEDKLVVIAIDIHSFIHPLVFTEYLLCTQYHSCHKHTAINKSIKEGLSSHGVSITEYRGRQ